ncbi:hypothetical protein BJ741DRAFT_615150 [Chytriomyces cf. hyalinus JEL632]|nr:hypothetical protein BJ741DRAFT_615150 [Chytriomyces cf. hyalinus JEL632]
MSSSELTGLPLAALVFGLCIDSSFKGLINSVPRFINALRRREPVFLMGTLVCFNAFALANFFLFLPTYSPTQSNCVHAFMIIFDIFILNKSYITARHNKIFLVLAVLSIANRVGWSVADVFLLQISWDEESGFCNYQGSALTGFYYNLADKICDAFATGASMVVLCMNGLSFHNGLDLFTKIAIENAVRSLLALIINVVVMYLVYSHEYAIDGLIIAWGFQDYIYVNLMNMELFYKEVRAATASNIICSIDLRRDSQFPVTSEGIASLRASQGGKESVAAQTARQSMGVMSGRS